MIIFLTQQTGFDTVMYVNLEMKFLLCIFFTLTLLLIVPTVSAQESTKDPINIVFEIHSHEDKIVKN